VYDKWFVRYLAKDGKFPVTIARAPFYVHCPGRFGGRRCGKLNRVETWNTAWSGFRMTATLDVIHSPER